ncbi:hypothetical protein DES41_10769 [Pseudorhodoferax soli]|uniref:Uncharacterized protein n=1 Tax=Pseudorhodoferax soli TaxID=545864 RepID=A0A368XNF4_9BURK|nr:hypothetical protein DES41_10769 [Pseudorhodoferax soli]
MPLAGLGLHSIGTRPVVCHCRHIPRVSIVAQGQPVRNCLHIQLSTYLVARICEGTEKNRRGGVGEVDGVVQAVHQVADVVREPVRCKCSFVPHGAFLSCVGLLPRPGGDIRSVKRDRSCGREQLRIAAVCSNVVDIESFCDLRCSRRVHVISRDQEASLLVRAKALSGTLHRWGHQRHSLDGAIRIREVNDSRSKFRPADFPGEPAGETAGVTGTILHQCKLPPDPITTDWRHFPGLRHIAVVSRKQDCTVRHWGLPLQPGFRLVTSATGRLGDRENTLAGSCGSVVPAAATHQSKASA